MREKSAEWLSRMHNPKQQKVGLPERPQVALPVRADLPLRARLRSLVAVPAQITGARMGSGKL